MNHINLDIKNIAPFVTNEDLDRTKPSISSAHKLLIDKSGPGNEYLGWLQLHSHPDELIKKIEETASFIKENAKVLICIGIGGSYLGAKAAIEFANHTFHNQQENSTEIYFAGHNISSDYLADLLDIIQNKDVCINVISKSGTTLEPAASFRVLRLMMEEKYGKDGAAKRIIATTDSSKGTLKELAGKEGYTTFSIPDDVGGRFSVLSPVGLLPIAVAGIDIKKLLKGAANCAEAANQDNISSNQAYLYAAIRNILYRKGKLIEVLSSFNPSLHFVAEWWKQLSGESEGKDQQGIFPASVDLTTDLHSMGQWLQDGRRTIFETFMIIEKANREIKIPFQDGDEDGLNYISGKSMDFINQNAYKGTAIAHLEGGVPNMTINLADRSPETLGELFFFFEKAVAISGYMQWINPFDQPGVEFYKKNMFKLLGKPGAT